MSYFFSPTERFFSLRSDVLHLRHLSAWRGLRAPHLRQTLKKSRLFCAICFFVTSAIGKVSLGPFHFPFQPVACLSKIGTSAGVIATLTPALLSAEILDSAVP